MQLGLELAAVNDVPGQRAADFDLDWFRHVIANPLSIDLMVIPAGDGSVFDLHDASAANLAEFAGAVNLQPDVAAKGAEAVQLKNHFRIRPEIQLDFVADRDVLD